MIFGPIETPSERAKEVLVFSHVQEAVTALFGIDDWRVIVREREHESPKLVLKFGVILLFSWRSSL